MDADPAASAAVRPKVALLALGRATFDLGQARALLERSRRALQALPVELTAVSELATAPEAAAAFAGSPAAAAADLLLCQFTTFVDARLPLAAAEAARDVPFALWALREPGPPGGRLSLNSLTGANLAGHELWRRGRPFRLVLGDPEEPGAAADVGRLARAAAACRWLRGFTVLLVGDAPDGFFFASPAAETLAAAGLRLAHLPLAELFERALGLPAADGGWRERLAWVRERVAGLERLPPEQVERFARALAVVEAEVARRAAHAVAVRCWPEFFTAFGAAACSLLSALNERGTAAACEADVLGALTMGLLARLAGGPPYLGDLAFVDRERDALVFWHCGAGAFRLASPRTGAQAGVHPNRGLGFTLEFGLRPGRVTLARLGQGPGGRGLRLLVGGGEVLDAPQRFLGTTATVRLDGPGPAEARARRLIEAGWEPHYALVYGDVRTELREVAALLGVPVEEA
jgi:L-fucose isomerase-like protein